MAERMTDAEFEAATVEQKRLRDESDRLSRLLDAANVAASMAWFRLEKEKQAREVDRLVAERIAAVASQACVVIKASTEDAGEQN